MNLPNFINFEAFNSLRRKMHTDRLGHFGGSRGADNYDSEKAAVFGGPEAEATSADTVKPKAQVSANSAAKPQAKSAAKPKAKVGAKAKTAAKAKVGVAAKKTPAATTKAVAKASSTKTSNPAVASKAKPGKS